MTFQRERFLKCARGLLKLPETHNFDYNHWWQPKGSCIVAVKRGRGIECDSVGCVIGSMPVIFDETEIKVVEYEYVFTTEGVEYTFALCSYNRIGSRFFGIEFGEAELLFSPLDRPNVDRNTPWGRKRLNCRATARQLHSYMMAFYKWKVAQEEDAIRRQEQIDDDRKPRN